MAVSMNRGAQTSPSLPLTHLLLTQERAPAIGFSDTTGTRAAGRAQVPRLGLVVPTWLRRLGCGRHSWRRRALGRRARSGRGGVLGWTWVA